MKCGVGRIAPLGSGESLADYAVDVSASAATLDLLSWIDARPRSYDETIDAWKTSCPRLSVWDDAVTDGLVWVDRRNGQGPRVALTARGRNALADLARTASSGVQDDRDRAVVHERDVHASAEHTHPHLDA